MREVEILEAISPAIIQALKIKKVGTPTDKKFPSAQKILSKTQLVKLQLQINSLNLSMMRFIVRDFNHGIIFWNKGAEKLYGWSLL